VSTSLTLSVRVTQGDSEVVWSDMSEDWRSGVERSRGKRSLRKEVKDAVPDAHLGRKCPPSNYQTWDLLEVTRLYNLPKECFPHACHNDQSWVGLGCAGTLTWLTPFNYCL